MMSFSKGLLLLLSVGSTIALGIVAAGGLWLIPQFEELFDNFGDGIPLITRIVFYSYKLWLAFPIVTLIAGADVLRRTTISDKHETMASLLFIGGIILAFLLSVISIWAMYAPIIKIATVAE